MAKKSKPSSHWRVTFELATDGPTGVLEQDRVMVCKKAAIAPDVKDMFRKLGRPENALMGVMLSGYNYFGNLEKGWGVHYGNVGFPFKAVRVCDRYYQYTGIREGETFPGLIGFEWDRVYSTTDDAGAGDYAAKTPTGLVKLGDSRGVPESSAAGLDHGSIEDCAVSNAVRFTFTKCGSGGAPAGPPSKVFSTGSMRWLSALDSDGLMAQVADPVLVNQRYVDASYQKASYENDKLKQMAANVFADMNSRPLTPAPHLIVTESALAENLNTVPPCPPAAAGSCTA